MTKLTKAQRARLDKLATYLEGLPTRYKSFDMSQWIDGLEDEALAKYARHNGGMCGTVACAAGHGPAAGVLVPPRLVEIEDFAGQISAYVDWEGYCELFVGDDLRPRAWVFNGSWAGVDNHHHGAAARIRYLLDHGSPPESFEAPRLRGLNISRKFRALYAPYRIDRQAADKARSAGT